MAESSTETQVNPFEMTGMEQLTAIIDGTLPPAPIAETIGLVGFEILAHGSVAVELDPRPGHYNPIGSVHGGVHSTILDTACGCSVHSTLEVGEGYTTLDLSVKFLRPVTMDSGRLRAVGTVIQRGGRTALAEAKLHDGAGRLVAYATSSCLILR